MANRPLLLAVLVAACSGDSPSPTSAIDARPSLPANDAPPGTSTPDAPPGTSTPDAPPGTTIADAPIVVTGSYLVPGFGSAHFLTDETVYAVDPSAPTPAAFSDSAVFQGFLPTTSAFTVDSGSHAVTFLGSATMVYVVKAGTVDTVDLRAGAAHTASQRSSLTTACDVTGVTGLDVAGLDAWIAIAEAGPDENCLTTPDNRTRYVRTTMAATAAAVSPSGGGTLVGPLLDPDTGLAVGLLVLEPGKLALYDPDLQRVGDVAGGGGVSSVAILSNEIGFASGLYRVDGTLRRLTFSAGSASLSASLYAFAGAAAPGAQAQDDAATYFGDGATLVKVAIGGAAQTVTTLAAGTIELVAAGQTRLVMMVETSGSSTAIASVPKAGGTVVPLPGTILVAVRGDRVVVQVEGQSGSSLRAVDADGQNDQLLAGSITIAGAVRPPVLTRSLPADAVIYCVPAADESTCAHGSLVQADIASGATTTLGSFSSSASGFIWIPILFFSGVPSAVQVSDLGTLTTDLYIVTPGSAGSLVRISHNLP